VVLYTSCRKRQQFFENYTATHTKDMQMSFSVYIEKVINFIESENSSEISKQTYTETKG